MCLAAFAKRLAFDEPWVVVELRITAWMAGAPVIGMSNG